MHTQKLRFFSILVLIFLALFCGGADTITTEVKTKGNRITTRFDNGTGVILIREIVYDNAGKSQIKHHRIVYNGKPIFSIIDQDNEISEIITSLPNLFIYVIRDENGKIASLSILDRDSAEITGAFKGRDGLLSFLSEKELEEVRKAGLPVAEKKAE